MTEHPHPLGQPLPPDVAAGESTFIRFYQKYAVFSWPWAWRRTVLFGSFGVAAGVSFGTLHGLYVRDAWEGFLVALACSVANIALVGAGPLLASIFRHLSIPRRLQRALIVGAVICGIAAGALLDDWSAQVHNDFMAAHGTHSPSPNKPSSDAHMMVRRVLDVSRDLFILFVASGGFALPAYFSERRRWAEHWRRVELEKMSLQKTESDMKLTLLQAQVEPHFLFNTLASVRSLVTSDPPRAAHSIEALTRYLRATLPKLRAGTGTPQSTLEEQFEICASYLELMQVRLGERLHVDLQLPKELRAAPFPPLLLISLVENAIKHGVEPKTGPARVTLAARALSSPDRPTIEVTVDDDGAGLTLGMGEGTGLANIRAQLRTRFGAAASLELTQRDSGGVRARLVLPREPDAS